jgi:hypothetical protein
MKNTREWEMNLLDLETSIISSALVEGLCAVISKTQLAMRVPYFLRLDFVPKTNSQTRALFISKEETIILNNLRN